MFHAIAQFFSRRATLAFGAAALLFSTTALCAPPINTLKGGVLGGQGDAAILGYDPVAYFTDAKLYLNYNASVQATWLKDPAAYIKLADAMFQALLKK